MIPLLKQRRLSLYADLRYVSYVFDCDRRRSKIFSEHSYSHYIGGISASYIAALFGHPFVLSADISADGWKEGWGMLQGRFVAALVLTRSRRTGITLGAVAMTLGKIPILPVVSYWHLFNADWSVDISLPSQLFLRYQREQQRLSFGCTMSGDNFYLRTTLSKLPPICYYSEASLNPSFLYEYIINRHFYLSAKAGVSMAVKSAFYTKSGKELGVKIKQSRHTILFFSIGLSYSIFR